MVRSVVLLKAADWDAAGVQKLIDQAVDMNGTPMDRRRDGRLLIRSVSASQRPRRSKN